MTVPGVVLGERVGPFAGCLGEGPLQQYAAVVGADPASVHPVALVTQIWDAQNDARGRLVPAALQDGATGGVHGEHDIVVHRPIVPGEPLRTWVEGHGSRPAGRNSLVTLRYTTVDATDAVVAEQWWTTVYLGITCEVAGAPPPPHPFPDDVRARSIRTWSTEVDVDLPRRYAEVSGDWSDHHFSVDAARASGVDRPFLHGLCTMALGAQAVVEVAAGGDASRVRRVAVRFAAPTLLGEQLDVALYDAGPGAIAFEATCAGATVIAHGRTELR